MELKTVAEYVETDEARELLVSLGVDYAQGHVIGVPVAIDAVLADLTSHLEALAR
jgi:EAL domain-containing protein (putative c-di-GMP-specific phosphodiesterase class I)